MLQFKDNGLLPAVVQHAETGQVLMVGYMNPESVRLTLETGDVWFYSRSRQTLWNKGEQSGHRQRVCGIYLDCDSDTLLIQVEQEGVACHTGFFSCFHREVQGEEVSAPVPQFPPYTQASFLAELFEVIQSRALSADFTSYTARLLSEGREKILRKIAEETTEVLLATLESDDRNREHLRWEVADLFYHLLVLLQKEGLSYYEVMEELQKRRKKPAG